MEYVEESEESENETSDKNSDIEDDMLMNNMIMNNMKDSVKDSVKDLMVNKNNKIKLKKKKDKFNKNIKKDMDKNRSFDNNVGVIDRDISNIIKTNNNDLKLDTLRLSDLLELFQGPVQIKDRLIIATTNHYDKIKNSLPALFRHGRLTPLKFDYLDWDTLNLLCIHYFNKKMKHHPIEINISTSQIIELAIKYSLSNNSFDEFENELLNELQ